MIDPLSTLPEKERLFRWGRVFLGLCLFVAFLLLLALGVHGWNGTQLEHRFQALLTKTNETDPGWQLNDIEAARVQLPEWKNSARIIVQIPKITSPHWPGGKLNNLLRQSCNEILTKEDQLSLEIELRSIAAAVKVARQVIELPQGRHDSDFSTNFLNAPLFDQQIAQTTSRILAFDSFQRALNKDLDGALASTRGMINCGRSMGDEPLPICQFLRGECVSRGLKHIERALALGEASEKALEQTQQLLVLEESHPGLLIAVRGERAKVFQIFEGLYDRSLTAQLVFGPNLRDLQNAGWRQRWFGLDKSDIRRQQLKALQILNRRVEIAQLPLEQQLSEESLLDSEIDSLKISMPILGTLLNPVSKINSELRTLRTQLRCMISLVAVERYRLQNGKWPATLKKIVPGYLDKVPDDPHNGKPLRYLQRPDGVMVYSVGENGVDDGGDGVGMPRSSRGSDVGYRLWNLEKRRLPPSVKPTTAPGFGKPSARPGAG